MKLGHHNLLTTVHTTLCHYKEEREGGGGRGGRERGREGGRERERGRESERER